MSIKVAVLGASGETGRSIVDGLLQAPTNFEIVALTRPGSMNNALNAGLKEKGVRVVAADLKGPEDALVKILEGIDIVISAVNWQGLGDQFPLVDAAKKAGVKRFIPCNFATIMAPRGAMPLRDQIAIPRVPSGRADNAVAIPSNTIVGTGDVSWALTDLRDVGHYVARIIVDDRTLNKSVFFYAEQASQNEVVALMEKLSGEKIETMHITEEIILKQLAQLGSGHDDHPQFFGLHYLLSQSIRGDNNPEYARYLGHLIVNDFYPELKPRTLESFFREVLDDKVEKVSKSLPPRAGEAQT